MRKTHHQCLFLSLSCCNNWYFLQKYKNKEIDPVIIVCHNTYSVEESTNNKVRYQYLTSIDYKENNSRNVTYLVLLHQSFYSKTFTNFEEKRK